MTRIINGIAQPDIVSRKPDEVIYIFIETLESIEINRIALLKSWQSIKHKEPKAIIRIELA